MKCPRQQDAAGHVSAAGVESGLRCSVMRSPVIAPTPNVPLNGMRCPRLRDAGNFDLGALPPEGGRRGYQHDPCALDVGHWQQMTPCAGLPRFPVIGRVVRRVFPSAGWGAKTASEHGLELRIMRDPRVKLTCGCPRLRDVPPRRLVETSPSTGAARKGRGPMETSGDRLARPSCSLLCPTRCPCLWDGMSPSTGYNV